MRIVLALLLLPFASALVAEDPAGDAVLEPGGLVPYPPADLRSLDVRAGEQLEISLTMEQLGPNIAGAWFLIQFNHETSYYSMDGYIGSEGGLARFQGETYDMTIEGNTGHFLFPMRHVLNGTDEPRTLQNFSVQTNARPTYICIVGGTPTCTNSFATISDYMQGDGQVTVNDEPKEIGKELQAPTESQTEAKDAPAPFFALVAALIVVRRFAR